MITVTCYYADGDTINTKFNGTPDQAHEYFVGKTFNIGSVDDNMQTCASITIDLSADPEPQEPTYSEGNTYDQNNELYTDWSIAWKMWSWRHPSGTDLARTLPDMAANLVLTAYTQDTGTTQNTWDVLVSAFGQQASIDMVLAAASQPRYDGVDVSALLRSIGIRTN